MMEQSTFDSFVLIEEPELATVDRSCLERAARCPAQQRFVDSGRANAHSDIANAGSEAHEAFSLTIQEFLDGNGNMQATELRHAVEQNVLAARPDVQPNAIRGVRSMLWQWSKLIASYWPHEIVRFDGGEGDKSGQLAEELDALPMIVTSEIDLLLTTASPEVLEEIDYKTGWKQLTEQDVADSFQFQLHAWLVLHNYPDVNCLNVRIWNTRRQALTYRVEFHRKDLDRYHTRIVSAAGHWYRHRNTPPELAPTWPSIEKCPICPARMLCPVAGETVVPQDPRMLVVKLAALEAAAESCKTILAQYVDATGEDIDLGDGTCFGRNKPPTGKKKPVAIYEKPKPQNEGDEL